MDKDAVAPRRAGLGLMHSAPMAGISDRHYRMLMRCVSPSVVVWTEMTWDRTILEAEASGTLEAVLGFSDAEHPIVLQLGGSTPEMLAQAARLGADRGYDEINLNCGCPAGQGGEARECYGARLMLQPARVAACCSAIRAAVGPSVPVTVKCRLGVVDGRESYAELVEFIRLVATEGGVTHFIVHARHAMLNLNASRNRTVPPLRYEWVEQLLVDFPDITFTVNGGVCDEAHACELLLPNRAGGSDGVGIECSADAGGGECGDAWGRRRALDGVMIGRRAKDDPFLFARADRLFSQQQRVRADIGPGPGNVGSAAARQCAPARPDGEADHQQEGCATGVKPAARAEADAAAMSTRSASSDADASSEEGSVGSCAGGVGERTRRQVLERYCAYVTVAQGANWGGGHPDTLVRSLLAPLGGLFYDTPCGPRWRQALNAAVKERTALRCVPVDEIVWRCVETSGAGSSGLLDEPPSLGVAARRRAREQQAMVAAAPEGPEAGSEAQPPRVQDTQVLGVYQN